MTDTTIPDRPTARQMYQHILDRTDLPMPTDIRTSPAYPHTLWIEFDHGTGDGGGPAAALSSARAWIVAIAGSTSYDRAASTTYQVVGYATWHGWAVHVDAIVGLDELEAETATETTPDETPEHNVIEGGGSLSEGYHLTCSCGYETAVHREIEDADGAYADHLRALGGEPR